MKRCVVAVMMFVALGSPVWANDVLTVSGQSLTWDPSSQPSPQFNLGIQNVSNTDLLIAWSANLEIVPVGSASGLSFASVSTPTNYLLGANSDGFLGAVNSDGSKIFAYDSAYTEGPVVVPASGENLLSATFSALSGAQGEFNIVAVPDLNNGTYWYSSDQAETTFTQYAFQNVPFGNGDPGVVIGHVTISSISSVPEPRAALLLASGMACLVACSLRRRVRAAGIGA